MWAADILIEWVLGGVYDQLEDRYGRLVAWLVTLTLALGVIAALVTILIVML
jgi:hypothetical protein